MSASQLPAPPRGAFATARLVPVLAILVVWSGYEVSLLTAPRAPAAVALARSVVPAALDAGASSTSARARAGAAAPAPARSGGGGSGGGGGGSGGGGDREWRCPYPRKDLSCAARDRALHHLETGDIELCLWNENSAGHYEQLSQFNKPTHFAWNRKCVPGKLSSLFVLGSIERADDLRDCCPDNDTIRVFLTTEPPAILPDMYTKVAARTGDFDAVLSLAGPELLRGENVIYWPWGSSWVPLEEWQVFPKTRLCSIIASNQKFAEGHRLRHTVVELFKQLGFDCDVMGHGYKRIGYKKEGLADYMFSIVIENGRQEGSNYMTEKIIDSLACGTVPVYWGNKIAQRHFGKGLIVWDTVEELRDKVLPRLTRATYDEMLPAIRANLEEAKKFAPPERWLWDNVFGCAFEWIRANKDNMDDCPLKLSEVAIAGPLAGTK